MKFVSALISVLVLFLGLVAFAAPSPESFLQEQKLIRIYVDSAPGFGHQSAGISVMRRLREIGFHGEFEVVYQPSVAAKIKKIYPGFPEGIEHEVHYIAVQDYQELRKQGKIQSIPLAISGADDGFGVQFARISSAKNYLRLQPLGWGDSALYDQYVHTLTSLKPLPLTNISSPDTTQFQETLNTQTDLPEDKKAFAKRFAELAPDHFSFPVYGVGIQAYAAARMYFYAKAVKAAAQKLNSSKAVIIPVVSPFNELEMDMIQKTFGKTPGFEAASATELRGQKQMHLLSPAEFAELKALKPGNLYFVFVGSVPQNVYNFFYEQANLPVWVAGKNAMSFAASKGKAYLNTVDDYHLPGKENLSPAASNTISRAYTAFSVGFQEYANQTHLSNLNKFIQQAATPGTEINNFYSGIGKQMSSNDKVLEGLRNVIGSPSELMCKNVFF